MSKVINHSGDALTNHTYYTVQYGLILCVAYYNEDIWYVVGSEPIPTPKLREDLIVVQALFTQDELAKDIKVTVA